MKSAELEALAKKEGCLCSNMDYRLLTLGMEGLNSEM